MTKLRCCIVKEKVADARAVEEAKTLAKNQAIEVVHST
jgi:hypothetical protein